MPPGIIPQSDALAEASPESLSDLFSRDPGELGQGDLVRMIRELRKQRERWLAAGEDSEARRATPKAPRQAAKPVDLGQMGGGEEL